MRKEFYFLIGFILLGSLRCGVNDNDDKEKMTLERSYDMAFQDLTNKLMSNPSVSEAWKPCSQIRLIQKINKLRDLRESFSKNTFYPNEVLVSMDSALQEMISELEICYLNPGCMLRTYIFGSKEDEDYCFYNCPIFNVLSTGKSCEFLSFLQFHLCSPYIQQFIREQLKQDTNSAMKRLLYFLLSDFSWIKDKEVMNAMFVSRVKEILFDLLYDDAISCNIVWQDMINDQPYVDLFDCIAFKKEDSEKNPIPIEELYLNYILSIDFFDYDKDMNRLILTKERTALYDNIPSTIVVFLCHGKFEGYKTSHLFIDDAKYVLHATYNFDECEREHSIFLSNKSEWLLLRGIHKYKRFSYECQTIPRYLMYILE